jgi:hypothetical protein
LKHNFNRMVETAYWSIYTQDHEDCYIRLMSNNWIQCSFCEKWLHGNRTVLFKPCFWRCFTNIRKTSITYEKESHYDTEHWLFCLITGRFARSELLYISFYVSPPHLQKLLHLHFFVICVTVSKSSEILCKGTDCCIVETRSRVFHT